MFGRHCELFCLLCSPKWQLDEVVKAMIQVVEWDFEVIFCFMTNRKCDFFQVDKATIQVVEWKLKTHSLPLDKLKIRLW